MPNNSETTQHRIYLLTIWREKSEHPDEFRFRFSLEDPRTGTRFGFTSLGKLETILNKTLWIEESKDDLGSID